ncbi:hypothetical protein GDO81_027846 [Engystomops pustulosus]|uniref:Uncharacterized protein n=1 Tax=Engystomops pustulosus TaxID=76066 RepID=A0AAV6ZM25_ENGPU|nr:hypothetical protein GDO81_027846 [Engystomops pustulosus]KAG8547656.1 hypothetical protein GDO81_027846 [Engystomops pustulosus]
MRPFSSIGNTRRSGPTHSTVTTCQNVPKKFIGQTKVNPKTLTKHNAIGQLSLLASSGRSSGTQTLESKIHRSPKGQSMFYYFRNWPGPTQSTGREWRKVPAC